AWDMRNRVSRSAFPNRVWEPEATYLPAFLKLLLRSRLRNTWRPIMADLTRISISLEDVLLAAFDRSITARRYATRSEAVRDRIRDPLIREEAKGEQGETAERVAVLTLVYDHHARELAARLIDKQHHHHHLVVSSLHVHLGERHCLEVSVLRGPAAEVRHLGEELLSIRGVLHGEITFPSGERHFR